MRRPGVVPRRPTRIAGVLLAAAVALAVAACGGTAAPRSAADLTNPRLLPEGASWLVGPIGRMASPQEVAAYLELTDDAAAADFQAAFWARRDPDPTRPGNPVRELFERRAAEADRRFAEAGYIGRRTDRGTLYVLYGEPESVEFEVAPRQGESPIEVWTYARDAGPGLDGRRPAASYRFMKSGDLTRLYLVPVDQRDRVPRGTF